MTGSFILSIAPGILSDGKARMFQHPRWPIYSPNMNTFSRLTVCFSQSYLLVIRFIITLVYGVKVEHTDGKAGMLSLTVKPLFNLKAFAEYVSANLPAYARPVFVRLRQDENEKTSTFKFQKSKYVLESFDLEHCSPDDVYVWQRQGDGGTYIQLDKSIMSSIQQGQYRF